MDINEQQLEKEIKLLEHKLNHTKNVFSDEYGGYELFCQLYCNITGIDLSKELHVNNLKIKKYLQMDDKEIIKLYNYFNQNQDIFYETSNNYLNEFGETVFITSIFYDKLRQYSDNEIKDITLDFYSKFGNNEYKIVKKYLDEDRIQHFGVDSTFDTGGFYYYSKLLETGYIELNYPTFSSETFSGLIHELGHAVDMENYYINQQKKKLLMGDLLSEVSSTFYEMAFNDYLIKNNIDLYGGLVMSNSRYCTIMDDAASLDLYFQTMNFAKEECGPEEKVEVDILTLRDVILYYLGYYFSIHLNQIYKDNPNEFRKLFNNFLTSRKELGLKELIEILGIDIEDFKSGKLIYPVIKENNKKLTKMLSK